MTTVYMDFFHFRNKVTSGSLSLKEHLLKLHKIESDFGCDIVFVIEPYAQQTNRYKKSLQITKRLYGKEIPYKDIRTRISERYNGCTVCTSKKTNDIIKTIDNNGFSIIKLSDIEFDTFIPITANTTNKEIIAVSSDTDVYHNTAWFENLKTVTYDNFLIYSDYKHCSYKELLFHMFTCFLYGKPKDNVFGLLYEPLLLDYSTISKSIVYDAPNTNKRDLITFIEKRVDNYKHASFDYVLNILKKEKSVIQEYLKQKTLTELYNHNTLVNAIYNVFLSFLSKHNIPFKYDKKTYFDYIKEMCFDMY